MNTLSTISAFTYQHKRIADYFPALQQKVYGQPLIYFDNAATTQKPQTVIDAIARYYSTINSNVHRGVHYLSQLATEASEETRRRVARFIHARYAHEIIFTRGTTESINLVAYSYSKAFLKPGDNVVISAMEHHSNIVPWQIACEDHGATLRVIPMNERGELLLDELDHLVDEHTRMLAITWISNSLGTVNPVREIIEKAHQLNIPVLIDAAQAAPHMPIDVQAIDCDFLAFSGHKMYGPTGIGVLYGKEEWLDRMPPYQGGGEMIKSVRFEKTEYNDLPFKFEAGTPHIEGTVCLQAALDFLESLPLADAFAYEQQLLEYATRQVSQIPGLRIIGQAAEKASILSFIIEGTHPYDVGVLLDKMGIAVRTGHHCTQPVMDFFGIPGTVRVSLAVYNTPAEIDRLTSCLDKALSMLK
ncbi:aminotransferase class V-fold PLP-dependent enzyme [Thermoflavifilum thermophilum]|uniref:Cysteine desulfurase n=1 Tax=Thermoflavifilum thermophilum TaxID=1393122 RepID=A0A1I7N062_9BACT|nr:cysteine desulfurase [Thermoflavifilum thermophilum]SFV28070.1 cysteine desulfurase / selenocysteine lyase [Thermoflavifilum thermophilum]